jgi:Ni/Co efflux regulator RcnB
VLKRLALLLAATTALIGSPLALDLAHAQGRGRDRGGEGRGWERRGPPEGRGFERRGRGGEPRSYERRYVDEDQGRGRGRGRGGDDRPRSERRGDDDDRGRPRRGPGGYLPPESRGGVVEDPGRYRLRPAPRGFAWVRMGNGFALVSLADGRIYDRID